MGAAASFCDGCGRPRAEGEHDRCRRRRAATDPPRFCVVCGRKLVVQVLPLGWTARCVRCGPVASDTVDGPSTTARASPY